MGRCPAFYSKEQAFQMDHWPGNYLYPAFHSRHVFFLAVIRCCRFMGKQQAGYRKLVTEREKRMAQFPVRNDRDDAATDIIPFLFLPFQIRYPHHWLTGICLPERKNRSYN